MILDTPCSVDGCNCHVDLVQADFDPESLNWIHYYNCLGGHNYIQISANLLVGAEDFYQTEDSVDYYQPTLFDDDDPALD